jgi:hypothetical protein
LVHQRPSGPVRPAICLKMLIRVAMPHPAARASLPGAAGQAGQQLDHRGLIHFPQKTYERGRISRHGDALARVGLPEQAHPRSRVGPDVDRKADVAISKQASIPDDPEYLVGHGSEVTLAGPPEQVAVRQHPSEPGNQVAQLIQIVTVRKVARIHDGSISAAPG